MRIIGSKRLSFIALIYIICAVVLGIWLFNQDASLHFILFEVATHFTFLFLFTYILSRIHLFFHSKNAINNIHLGTVALFSIMGAYAAHGIMNLIPTSGFETIFVEEYFVLHIIFFFLLLLLSANQFWIDKHIIEQEKTTEELVAKERKLVQAELSNIQEQFKPHFLFNSLNSISALTLFEPEKARTMIQHLSDYLRASVNRSTDELIPFEDEINYVNLYLEIEKTRFEDRLSITFNQDENAKNFLVPAMILQPVIENAIKYGVYGNTGNVSIDLNATLKDGKLEILVTNPYDKDASSKTGKGFGLQGLRKRLYLLYSRNDLMQIEKTDHEFSILIKLPKK